MSAQPVFKKIHQLADIPSAAWDALNGEQHPLLSHAFLNALEQHIDLSYHGWYPQHYLVYDNNELIAAIPMYVKDNSHGEFVFDWSWADALHRTGRPYYPKMVACFPFAPVIGSRILMKQQDASLARQCIEHIIADSEEQEMSGVHFLYNDDTQKERFAESPCFLRYNWQYHWLNRGYDDFDDFLNALNSKRRKQIRKERRDIKAQGLEFEVLSKDEISEEHWSQFYDFYCSTFEKKWGEPRFTLDFFHALSDSTELKPNVFMATHGKEAVAGSFAMLGNDILYGRHWGCNSYFPNLHFELCYYQTIEFCISQKIQRLDAGIQGEHKIFRGFEPVPVFSAHWLKDEDFRTAVQRHVKQENRMIHAQIHQLRDHMPYRNDN